MMEKIKTQFQAYHIKKTNQILVQKTLKQIIFETLKIFLTDVLQNI